MIRLKVTARTPPVLGLAVALAMLAFSGCRPAAVLSYRNVAAPVMLSPVEGVDEAPQDRDEQTLSVIALGLPPLILTFRSETAPRTVEEAIARGFKAVSLRRVEASSYWLVVATFIYTQAKTSVEVEHRPVQPKAAR